MSEPSSHPERPPERWRTTAARVAAIFVGYCLIVAAVLLALNMRADPFEDPETVVLHERLRQQPTDTAAQNRLRELDRQHRQEYFARRRQVRTGGWLLLAGAVGAVVALRLAADSVPEPPRVPVGRPPDEQWDAQRVQRRSLSVVAAAVLFGALVVGTVLQAPMRSRMPDVRTDAPFDPAARPDADPALPVEPEQTWPRFRGAGGLARTDVADIPLEWSMAESRHVLWRAPVPLPGNSSPVVWGNSIFVTGGSERAREAYAFDAETGALLWRRAIPGAPHAKPPRIQFGTGYAAPTPAVANGRLFVLFATGDIAALDTADGALLWNRHMGAPDNPYGHASSPIADDRRVYVQMDVGQMADEELSELHALDARTGNLLWMVSRPVSASWTTPILIETDGRRQLVTVAPPWTIAYDPADGTELWRANLVSGEIAASPVFADGHVFVASEQCVAAIRADGSGDVTDTHVTWQGYDGLPDTVSPLTDGATLYVVTSYGRITCYDAQTGAVLWTHDIEAEFYSSPSLAGSAVLLADRSGDVHVFAAERAFRALARNDLGEPVHASPAFAPGRIWFRGETNLIAIGHGPANGNRQP